MHKKQIKFEILMALMLTMLISTSAFASSKYTRLSGLDRYETSSKIALNGWTQSDYAVLALGENYPDALCASPLAGKYKAPILLTEKDSLPPSTLSAIQQLKVKSIFIIGGTGVVSSTVENQLTSLGISITRLSGKDRYQTDIAVAKQLGTVSQIAVVTGEDYADALSIAPIAVKLNMPIIIVGKDNIPQEVKDYISSQSITTTYVIGKGTSIDNEDGLSNVTEINGADKYARNIAIISAFKNNFDFSTICLATGENFADALSGSVLAGMNGNPLILVGSDITNEKNLLKLIAPTANIKILGGIGAVADETVNDIEPTAATTTPSAIDVIPATSTTTSAIDVVPATSVNNSNVARIDFVSPNLTKIGVNTATFQYKILDKAGTDITKKVPASQLLIHASVIATIVLDPSTGIGTVTYNSASDVDKYNTVVIVDSISGNVAINMPIQNSGTSKVTKIIIRSTTIGVADDVTNPIKSHGNGYALYVVQDQNGSDITDSSLAYNIIFKCSVATITTDSNNGLLTIIPNTGVDLKTLTSVVITGSDPITGVSTSATLAIAK